MTMVYLNTCKILPFVLSVPGDSQGITKYYSDQQVSCWKQWRTDELVDVLCLSEAYEKVFWCFLDLSQFVSNSSRMLDKKFDI